MTGEAQQPAVVAKLREDASWMLEQVRASLREWPNGACDIEVGKEVERIVEAARREARLEEARWWYTRVAMAYMCDEQEMRTETRVRISELEAALASRAAIAEAREGRK